MMEDTEKFTFSKALKTVKGSLKAILMGKLLMCLNAGQYLIHISYVFLLFAAVIWISLGIDTTLTKVEDGKRRIKELEVIYTDKKFENTEATSREAVLANLKKLGSELGEPEKPANTIR